MWANDSVNAYNFPLVSEGDEYYSGKLYFDVLDVKVMASKDGIKQTPILYGQPFNQGYPPYGQSLQSCVYVDLNEVDASLEIRGGRLLRFVNVYGLVLYSKLSSAAFSRK